jgi:hypothetical protein
MGGERFKVRIEDVTAVMRGLPKELQRPGSGIVYDDGELVTADDGVAAQIKQAISRIGEGHKAHLLDYAAGVRRRHLEGSTVKVDGQRYPADDATLARLTAALALARDDASKAYDWKTLDGHIRLDADALRAVIDAILNVMQKCFAVEQALESKIGNGKITIDDIDGAAWPK